MTVAEKTLVKFDGQNGNQPAANLIVDANGDLFGTTSEGGTGYGTVFEVAKTASGYANSPITLFSFSQTGGDFPEGGSAIDSQGDLFGTTLTGGANSDGTVFEIAKTDAGYASAPLTLFNFNGALGKFPEVGLTIDASGDLFGTTSRGGAYAAGTVFEIAKTASGYANSVITLVSFSKDINAGSSLFIDSSGNLIGTDSTGGVDSDGRVYEVAKTATRFASSATTLVSFNSTDGNAPLGGVIADRQGDLFGTTEIGGTGAADGTVFEIAKTAQGYASTSVTLITFNNTDGAFPEGALKIDANGDLFGTTSGGGADGDGTAFELKKTAGGYASAPTTLATFNGKNGKEPQGSLVVNANGNLFGTTLVGGGSHDGVVFEVTGSGYATSAAETNAPWRSAASNKATMTFLPPGNLDRGQTGVSKLIGLQGFGHLPGLLANLNPVDSAHLIDTGSVEGAGIMQVPKFGYHGLIHSFDLQLTSGETGLGFGKAWFHA